MRLPTSKYKSLFVAFSRTAVSLSHCLLPNKWLPLPYHTPNTIAIRNRAITTPRFLSSSSSSTSGIDTTLFDNIGRHDSAIMNNDNEATIKHRKSYAIKGTGIGSAVTMNTNTNHTISTDLPKKMGGTDTAPQPVEHLLAALLGCTQATAVFVGRNMNPRLIVERMEFDIQGHRDERGALRMPISDIPDIPARLQLVSGVITVFLKQQQQQRKNVVLLEDELRFLSEQTEVRCPVANMMKESGCVMDIKWIAGDDNNSDDT